MTTLPSLPFVTRETWACHGGNDYRGPGAWKRPRKSEKRVGTGTRDVHHRLGGPLDLSRIRPDSYILNNTDGNDSGKINAASIGSRKRQRPTNPTASASKLSLEPLKAPFYGVVGGSMAIPSPSSIGPNSSATLSNVRDSSPTFGRSHGFLAKASASPRNFNRTSTGQENSSLVSRESGVEDGAAVEEHCRGADSCSQAWGRGEQDLRIPKAAVKIAVDDRCNAEVLQEQSFLRAIFREHAEIAMMIRERRFRASLTTKGGVGFRRRTSRLSSRSSTTKAQQRPQGRRHGGISGAEASGGSGGSPHGLPGVHRHPLAFMTEAELQQIELKEMRLEDAEAAHHDRLQEALKRKDDYSAYYNLALRYGPLADQEFRAAPYPGIVYRTKISHATRAIQNWWWCIWPPLLRRRKAGALAMQSIFRGFVQRKRWREIIRLRTLWGTTRVLAHGFVAWMRYAARRRRLATLTSRSRNRCLRRCLCAWAEQADSERRGKECLVRERLRRVGMGTIARVFEAWTSFAETSRTVQRMRQRSLSRPVLRVWRRRALSARRRRQVIWACSKLVSRGLRWQCRKRFLELRRACRSMQKLVRVKLTRAHFQRRITARRTQKARQMVLDLQDDRLRLLVEDELGRRERIHSVVAARVFEAKKTACADLQAQDKKRALFHCKRRVRSKLEFSSDTPAALSPESRAPSSTVILTEGEAPHEAFRSYERRERARARHDCNVQWPPPLCCPFPGCDSTFVIPTHGKRHAVEAHGGDGAAGIVELGLALSDPSMMAIFEKLLPGSKDGGRALARGCDGLDPTDLSEETHGYTRRALVVLKAVQRWRKVPSSSPHYRKLVRVVLSDLPDEDFSGDGSGVLLELAHGDIETARESHGSDGTGFDPEVLERACWEALVTLHAAIGEAFLRSRDYRKHVDSVEGLSEEAIADAFSEVVRLEHTQWLEEGRKLRDEALRLKTETVTERLAEDAVGVVAEGHSGVLAALIDDQVSLLSVMVTAERRAFRAIISDVLDLAVDDAVNLDSREQRSLSLTVIDALSEAATSKARSLVMDKLVDECVVELTGPSGEFWPDRGAAEALSDGVAYRVRDQVMEEEIDAVLTRLIEFVEVERLVSGDVAREDARRGERRLGSDGDTELGTGVDTTSKHRRYDCEGHVGSPYGIELFGDRAEEVESAVDRHDDADDADKWKPRGGSRKIDDASKREAEIDHAKKPSVSSLSIEAGDSSAVMDLPEGGLPGVVGEDNPGMSDSPALTPTKVSSIEGRIVPLDAVTVPSRKLASRGEDSAASNRGGEFITTSGDSSREERAATLIQAAARRRAVYRSTRVLVARSFVKLYDPASKAFYWYNHTTGESTWEKPGIIDKYFKNSDAGALRST